MADEVEEAMECALILAREVTRLRAEVERKNGVMGKALEALETGCTCTEYECNCDSHNCASARVILRVALTPSPENPPAKEAM